MDLPFTDEEIRQKFLDHGWSPEGAQSFVDHRHEVQGQQMIARMFKIRMSSGQALKHHVYAKTVGHCWYCGITLVFTDDCTIAGAACIDHAIPQDQGGSNDPENLIPACRRCNSSKNRKTVEEYRHYLHMQRSCECRAKTLLREVLRECQTPYDGTILEAITWLESQMEPIVFWGEKPHRD